MIYGIITDVSFEVECDLRCRFAALFDEARLLILPSRLPSSEKATRIDAYLRGKTDRLRIAGNRTGVYALRDLLNSQHGVNFASSDMTVLNNLEVRTIRKRVSELLGEAPDSGVPRHILERTGSKVFAVRHKGQPRFETALHSLGLDIEVAELVIETPHIDRVSKAHLISKLIDASSLQYSALLFAARHIPVDRAELSRKWGNRVHAGPGTADAIVSFWRDLKTKQQVYEVEQAQQTLRGASEAEAPEGVLVAKYYEPCSLLSGDFYGIQQLPSSNRLLIYFGDVQSKGGRSAIIAAQVIGALRSNGFATPSPLCRTLDERLCSQSLLHITTCFVGHLSVETGELIYCNAGHGPVPVVLRKSGALHILDVTGPPLGQNHALPANIPRMEFSESVTNLERGDLLILCSDGVCDDLQAHLASLRVRPWRHSPEELVRVLAENAPEGIDADDRSILLIGRE